MYFRVWNKVLNKYTDDTVYCTKDGVFLVGDGYGHITHALGVDDIVEYGTNQLDHSEYSYRIFEGDIILCWINGLAMIHVVEYLRDIPKPHFTLNELYKDMLDIGSVNDGDSVFEIIGNIRENPEMLNKEYYATYRYNQYKRSI